MKKISSIFYKATSIVPGKTKSFIALASFFFMPALFESLSAQVNAAVAPGDEIMTTDLSIPGWKSPVEFSTVLLTEKANITQLLADPNLKPHQTGLYTGYDRMVAYMQEDLAAHVPINEIPERNYKRILSEVPTDPVMKYMYPQDFAVMYEQLKARLIQP